MTPWDRISGALIIAVGIPATTVLYWQLAKWAERVYHRTLRIPRGGDE